MSINIGPLAYILEDMTSKRRQKLEEEKDKKQADFAVRKLGKSR